MEYNEEKVREGLTDMSVQEIEVFIKNNESTLLERTRLLAIEELKKKTSEEYAEKFLHELNKDSGNKWFKRIGLALAGLIILFGILGIFSVQVEPHEPSVSLFAYAGAFFSAIPYIVIVFVGFIIILIILVIAKIIKEFF